MAAFRTRQDTANRLYADESNVHEVVLTLKVKASRSIRSVVCAKARRIVLSRRALVILLVATCVYCAVLFPANDDLGDLVYGWLHYGTTDRGSWSPPAEWHMFGVILQPDGSLQLALLPSRTDRQIS